MQLESLATTHVVTVAPPDSLDTAIDLMDRFGIHHLPVVENGRLAGMVSDRDLLLAVGWERSAQRRIGRRGAALAGPCRVDQIMSRGVVSLSPEAALREAAATMIERRIGAIPLMRGGRLVGIVTKLDLLARFLDRGTVATGEAIGDEPVSRTMRANVTVVGPNEPLAGLIELMHDKHVRHVPVVVQDMVIGIVSDRDVRRALGRDLVHDEQAQERGKMYLGSTATFEIMTRHVRVVHPEAALSKAAQEMIDHRIGALPVINEQKLLVGIITDTDLVRILAALPE
jgi:acetoin utilization protein AcuB